jgi:hypothetical protein
VTGLAPRPAITGDELERAILTARDDIRAVMAPTGADLERLLMALHRQSAVSQKRARMSQGRARAELYRRLEGKIFEIDGTGEVVTAIVTTRELIGLVEAESNIVKTEAMAQRSYDVHRSVLAAASGPAVGGIEEFLTALEAEELTEQRLDADTTPSADPQPP